MSDLDLDLILPPEIRVMRGETLLATIPGELPVRQMLRVVQLQEDGRRHERVLLDTPNTAEFAEEIAEAQAGVITFYEQAAALLQEQATMVVEGELLELTASQIITVITLLGSPQERMQLVADALLRALDLGPEAEAEVPLEPASPATSSPSGAATGGRPRSGASSTGASSSRTARKRSKPKA